MSIEVKCLMKSSHPGCPDLITLQARYPRFIHSEVMTHRVFSRSASSSRAVPIETMIQDIEHDPAMPVQWGSNKPGMQAGAEIEWPDDAKDRWLMAADAAIYHAKVLASLGLHAFVPLAPEGPRPGPAAGQRPSAALQCDQPV